MRGIGAVEQLISDAVYIRWSRVNVHVTPITAGFAVKVFSKSGIPRQVV